MRARLKSFFLLFGQYRIQLGANGIAERLHLGVRPLEYLVKSGAHPLEHVVDRLRLLLVLRLDRVLEKELEPTRAPELGQVLQSSIHNRAGDDPA
jgi:hypothetical protein